MNTLKFIMFTSLLFLAGSFILYAEEHICGESQNKVMPIFMNGMFNIRKDAVDAAAKVAKRMQDVSSDIIIPDNNKGKAPYYLAYNKSENLLSQVGEVVGQYIFDGINLSDTVYTKEQKESYSIEIKKALLALDGDALEHKNEIEKLINEDYNLVFVAHSQGNIYFNILYDLYLSGVSESRYNVLSLASPVYIKGSGKIMLIESFDFIKLLRGLANYGSQGSLSNITNSDLKGHDLDSYLDGDKTYDKINEILLSFIKDLTVDSNLLSIDVDTDLGPADVDFTALEQHNVSMRVKSTRPGSIINIGTIKGNLTKVSDDVRYTLDCNFIENRVSVNIGVWNKSGFDANISSVFKGLYNDSVPDTVPSTTNEEYPGVGYIVNMARNGNIITSSVVRLHPNSDE